MVVLSLLSRDMLAIDPFLSENGRPAGPVLRTEPASTAKGLTGRLYQGFVEGRREAGRETISGVGAGFRKNGRHLQTGQEEEAAEWECVIGMTSIATR